MTGTRAPLPCQSDVRKIRLLHAASPTEYSLTVHDLDECPEFHALSYCWGTDEADETIICDGDRLAITPNLLMALNGLYDLGYHTLWIDAICIDQQNVKEKNHQVGLMGQIFRRASQTVVWLGPAGPDHESTVDLVHLLSQSWDQHRYAYQRTVKLFRQDELAKLDLPAWNDDREPALEPLARLLSLPWFMRAWCIQEFALAKEAVLVKGRTKFDPDDLINALSALELLQAYDGHKNQRYRRCIELGHTRQFVQQGTIDFIKLWSWHRNKLCKDDRDSVFSMLGILEKQAEQKGTKNGVRPDYGATLPDIYREFASGVLRDLNNLDMFYFHRPSDRPDLGLCSWVPDFGTTTQVARLYDNLQRSEWDASHSSQLTFRIQDRVLHLQTQLFDTIVATSEHSANAYPLANLHHTPEQRVRAAAEVGRILKSRIDACPRHGSYVTGQSARQAFWQTFWFAYQHTNIAVQDLNMPMPEAQEGVYINAASKVQSGDFDAVKASRELSGLLDGPSIRDWNLAIWLIMARTSLGYYCWVPWQSKVGDEVALVPGGRTPFAIRQTSGHDEMSYQMLGGCYVHGIMFGEAWDSGTLRNTWFE